MKEDKGKEVFYKLIKDADVVVENFRPGTLERLGADYETLKKHNPKIVLASISGFGQTGSYSQKPGYDILAQAIGGLMSVTGEPDGPPVKAGFSIADIGTGMWAIIGILAALREREVSGKGQWVDASLLDTMLSWQTYLAGSYFASNKNPTPLGGAHPNIVPYQVFGASDGYFIIAVGNDNLWNNFIKVMNMKVLEDEKYKTNPQRVENRDILIATLEEEFKNKTVKEWVDLFEESKIPAGPVNKFSEILEDEHVKEREMVVEVEDPALGKFRMLGVPVKLSRTPGEIKTTPPSLGEHSEEILLQLGYTNEEIENLIKNGVTGK